MLLDVEGKFYIATGCTPAVCHASGPIRTFCMPSKQVSPPLLKTYVTKVMRVTSTPFKFKGPAPAAGLDESKIPKDEKARVWRDPLPRNDDAATALAVDLCSHPVCNKTTD